MFGNIDGMESVCTMGSKESSHVNNTYNGLPEESNVGYDINSTSVPSPVSNHVPSTPVPSASPVYIPSYIRMALQLPECRVVLHRLTEEEIHRSYPSTVEDDVHTKTEELVRKTAEVLDMDYLSNDQLTYRKNGSKRKSSKYKPELFEFYKQKRQKFMSRRNKTSHSDNSLDWSVDDFKTASESGKGKKKSKRSKYERDFEWSPDLEKETVQSSRKLRRQVRRPVIDDSDSSSSDEDDVLYDIYASHFGSDNSSEMATVPNSVPSLEYETYEHNDTSTSNNSGSDLTFNKQEKKSSHTSHIHTDSSSNKSDNVSGDIISDIMNNMDKIKRKSSVTYPKPYSSVSNSVKAKPLHKERKRFRFSSEHNINSIEAEVSVVLSGLINKVCKKLKPGDAQTLFKEKHCKWCATPFIPKKDTEILCVICCDLGKQKYYESKKGIKPKHPKENKSSKKINSVMSRMLKIMPKSEKQRLMYTEKAVSSEKGYNHCKSFTSPKDAKPSSVASDNRKVSPHKISIKLNEKKKKTNNSSKKQSAESQKSVPSNKYPVHIAQEKILDGASKNKQFKKKDSMPKMENLFPITFPRSHGSSPKETVSEILNQKNKKIIPQSDEREINPNVSKSQHDTYLFPPIPTVIVSNYCNDANGLNLSHTYFQNEITHKQGVKNSPCAQAVKNSPSSAQAVKNSPSSAQSRGKTDEKETRSNNNNNTVITSNSVVQFLNPSLPTSNMLPSNTSLTITTIPINNTVNQLLPLSNTSSILAPIISSRTQNVTLMPVVRSVVSLSDATLNMPSVQGSLEQSFSSNNFVNSQNLGIKITHVSSEKTYEHITTHHGLPEVTAAKPEIRITSVESKSSSNNIQHPKENTQQNSPVNAGNKEKLTLNTDELTEQSCDISSKPLEDKEDAISSAMAILGAVSILAVVDLGKNPQSGLNVRIQVTKGHLAKLTSEKNVTPELNEQIATCQHNLLVLNIAKKYLGLYGSFARVSDFLLRKAKMIQIKKEIIEENNQSSCMYSQSNVLEDSRNSTSPASLKLEEYNSCRMKERSATNHIEKLQSQIAAMNNNTQVVAGSHFDTNGTVHHFPSDPITTMPPAIAAPTPVTPVNRNDCMGGESRETPSRGSGPRTPARPESAASQSEEQQSVIQIKKELMEGDSALSAQCAYSQNSTLTHNSSQLTVMPSISISEHSIPNNTVHQIPVSNTNHHLYSSQTNFPLPVEACPNRTVPFDNQHFSDVLLNIAKHQGNPGSEIGHNRQLLLGQQMYIQNNSRQPVPSVNNQYVVRPPFTASSATGGTVIVNNSQNALLTNVSNQQFYTSNPVSQLYYPASSQITAVPSTTLTPSIAAAPILQAEASPDQMVCAVCKNQATLRCKQCARVAYCNTTCAKTYWHQKHKMECKPLPS